jgi:hypothetical protein
LSNKKSIDVLEKTLTDFPRKAIVSTVEGGRWMGRQAAVILMIAACQAQYAPGQGFASRREISI